MADSVPEVEGAAGVQVVEDHHLMALVQDEVCQVAAEKPGSSGDDATHGRSFRVSGPG